MSCFNTGEVTYCPYARLWRMDGNVEQCVNAIKAGKVNSCFLSCNFDVADKDLFAIPQALKNNFSVFKLDLRGIKLTRELIVEIIKCGQFLHTLDLINTCGFSTMSSDDIEQITKAISNSNITKIWTDRSDMTSAQSQSFEQAIAAKYGKWKSYEVEILLR